MGTPLGWLERVPTYKDQIEKLEGPRPGDLRLPRLPAAAGGRHPDLQGRVRAGRRGPGVARRAHARGRAPLQPPLRPRARLRGAASQAALKKLGKERAKDFEAARKAFRENGDARRSSAAARSSPRAASLGGADRERLVGHLRGTGKTILRRAATRCSPRPAKLPGLDGTQDEQVLRQRDRDARGAGRGRRGRSGTCRPIRRACAAPIPATRRSARSGSCTRSTRTRRPRPGSSRAARTAGIGCLDCKQPVIDAIIREQAPWRERAEPYLADPKQVHWIVEVGTERARTRGARDDEGRARRDGSAATSRSDRSAAGQWRAARRPFAAAATPGGAAFLPSRLSVPANRRLMLAPWRQMSSPPITRSASATASGPSVGRARTARRRRRRSTPATNSGRTRR